MSDFGRWSVIKTIMEFMGGIQGYGKDIYKVVLDHNTCYELVSDRNFIYDEVEDNYTSDHINGIIISSEDSKERFFKLYFKNQSSAQVR